MALRIGPVGPVWEAGLGTGAGLGSEVTRRALLGVAVYPLALHVPSVSARVQRGASLLRWRRPIPNAAPRPVSFANVSPSVRRRRGTGLEKACGRSAWRRLGPQKPRRSTPPSLPASRSPSACEKPTRRGDDGVGDPSAGFAQRRLEGAGTASRGQRPGVPRVSIVVAVV